MRGPAIGIALLLLAGCGELNPITDPNGGGEPVDPTATFTRVQNEVFTPSCATLGCHDPLAQSERLVLTAGRAYAQIVGQPSVQMSSLHRVRPGEFADSYLYRKITGVGIVGERMPLSAPPLADAQVRLVRDWIRRGAPND